LHTRDARCPLTSVGCIFDAKNVYANIQEDHRPQAISWDLRNKACWKPFFGSKGGCSVTEFVQQSVQAPQLSYGAKWADEQRSELEKEVEDILMRAAEECRSSRVTDWNRSMSAELKGLLKRFEEDAAGTRKLTTVEHNGVLETVRRTYRLEGLPVNTSCTQLAVLRKRVLETNIFLTDAKVQFALASYVHAYPNGIVSVWVYVVSLEWRGPGDDTPSEHGGRQASKRGRT